MADHTISIVNRINGKGTRAKTSAVESVRKITQKPTNNIVKNTARGMRMIRTGDIGSSLGIMGGTKNAPGFIIAQESAKLIFKGADVGLTYLGAKTGEVVDVGNAKRIMSYLKNPTRYALDATWGVHLRNLENARRNEINNYYQNLTGDMEYSEAFGKK